MVCLDRPYHLKIFEGSLPQFLLDPFLNTLAQMISEVMKKNDFYNKV